MDNVTVYMFLYPILGPDSVEKSKAIWCSKDPAKTWQDWMVREQAIPGRSQCDIGALMRNAELGRKHKITGTPLTFIDGTRAPSGALDVKQVENCWQMPRANPMARARPATTPIHYQVGRTICTPICLQ